MLGLCRQAVAARPSDGYGNDSRLGDADLVSAAQRRRQSGDRIRSRVQVELLLRVDILLGRRQDRRAALRRAEPRRRDVLRVPCHRREPIRTQRTFAAVDARRRPRRHRSVYRNPDQ